MSFSCTIFLIVDDNRKQEILLYEDLLKRSGLKYELFTCSGTPISDDVRRLKPNLAFGFSHDFPRQLNDAVSKSTTEFIAFLNVPFIAQNDWLKEYVEFLEKSEANCLIVPYLNYRKDFHNSEYLNPYGEIMDVKISDTKPNDILGMHIFRTNTFYDIGGFVGSQKSVLNECLIHYRKKCVNVIVYNSFLNNIRDEFYSCNIDKVYLQLQPVRDFSPVEEIAFHNLDDFLIQKLKIEPKKFALDFIGYFGFRCDSLNSEQLAEVINYATFYNLQFEIKYAPIENTKRISKNIYVLMKTK